MKNKLDKVIKYYNGDLEKITRDLIVFIIGPLCLIYFTGIEKGLLGYTALVIFSGVIPWLLNATYNYIFKKRRLTKVFYLFFVLVLTWISINIIIYDNVKAVQISLYMGIVFFIMYKFLKLLK